MIVPEKEQLVLDDGATDGAAKLLPLGLRDETSGQRIPVALRERVSQLGGKLELESAPGEGTTLVIALPVLAGEPISTNGK